MTFVHLRFISGFFMSLNWNKPETSKDMIFVHPGDTTFCLSVNCLDHSYDTLHRVMILTFNTLLRQTCLFETRMFRIAHGSLKKHMFKSTKYVGEEASLYTMYIQTMIVWQIKIIHSFITFFKRINVNKYQLRYTCNKMSY